MTTDTHLRAYQRPAANAILRAVGAGQGGTYVLRMARQSGKNETSAWIERALMLRFLAEHRTGIKCAPTLAPQAHLSRTRLVRMLLDGQVPHRDIDPWVTVMRSRWGFFSAARDSNVVGQTADILLECDEAQDIDPEKFDKDFRPMAASTNSPVAYYGTPWTDSDLLAQAAALAADQQTPNQPHLFDVPWTIPAETLPAYAAFVQGERDRLGANHPLFLTQYEMKTIPSAGRLLTAAQLAATHGHHERLTAPQARHSYVAGIDVAGDSSASLDETVMLLARLEWPEGPGTPPVPSVVNSFAWAGTPHGTLYPAIAALAKAWGLRRVAVDSTGLGEALALYLERALDAETVIPVRFTERSKSDLGYAFQAAAATGRFLIWQDDGAIERATLYDQLRRCRALYKPNRMISWSVPASEGHDDYVAASALTNKAAEDCPAPRIARAL